MLPLNKGINSEGKKPKNKLSAKRVTKGRHRIRPYRVYKTNQKNIIEAKQRVEGEKTLGKKYLRFLDL